jgi:Holliday junction resolvase RusA-like endonuclease
MAGDVRTGVDEVPVTKDISFTIYGDPVAQGRPRFSTAGGFVKAYDPAKSRDYKDYVKLAAAEHAPKQLLEEALVLEIYIYRPIPKSFSKAKTMDAECGFIRPTTKPDVDNYLKGIKDALKTVIWKDDSQVVDVYASKFYSNRPRIEVTIKPVERMF